MSDHWQIVYQVCTLWGEIVGVIARLGGSVAKYT